MCHFCRHSEAPEMIKCRCGRCDGLEQDVCLECWALYNLSKKDFPQNFKSAWALIKARAAKGRE